MCTYTRDMKTSPEQCAQNYKSEGSCPEIKDPETVVTWSYCSQIYVQLFVNINLFQFM